MKKKIILFTLSVLIAAALAGCSSGRDNVSAPKEAAGVNSDSGMSRFEYNSADESYFEPNGGYGGYEYEKGEASSASVYSGRDLMFIKSAYINLFSDEFDSDLINIRNTVNNYGGYFETSNLNSVNSGGSQHKRYNATIRVPVENYETVKEVLENIGSLRSSSESSQEVSGDYFNIQSRLETSKSEEKRLLELIDETYDMDQLIKLEQRLGEVRTQIELYESQLKRIESLASYSTIVVDVTEVSAEELIVKDKSFLTRLGDGFKKSIDATVGFFQNILIFLTYIIIPLAIILILIYIGISIGRRITGKRKKGKDDAQESEND